MSSKCPNCGCNPNDEPYCMVATHCPKCGYIFDNSTEVSQITSHRKTELLNNMFEYLENYGVNLADIGVCDDIKDDDAYNICLGYIIGLVGNDGDKLFFENVLGFTEEEMIAGLSIM